MIMQPRHALRRRGHSSPDQALTNFREGRIVPARFATKRSEAYLAVPPCFRPRVRLGSAGLRGL